MQPLFGALKCKAQRMRGRHEFTDATSLARIPMTTQQVEHDDFTFALSDITFLSLPLLPLDKTEYGSA